MRPSVIAGKDSGGNSLLNYTYTYDEVGNITEKKTEHGDYFYGYDELDRLTSATNPTLDDETYTYDAVGNRLTDSKAAGEWAYADDDSLTSRPGVTYQYDANGSLIEKDDNGTITRYVYDVTGRMSEVRDGSDNLISSYAYDPFGRRIKKTVNGATTYFLYSDEGVIAETDSTGNITRQYGWKPGGIWGRNPLYLLEGSTTYYYQNDHLGTPQKLISGSGAVVWSAKYDSFGLAYADSATVDNPLRFPGQYYDQETRTHYNYFRDYEPSIGRYVESDPIGLAGGWNTFGYVRGNPVSFFDHLGLYRWDGYMYSAGYSEILAFTLNYYVLTSQCVNGYKYVVKIRAIGFGVGASLFPVGGSSSSATFFDSNTSWRGEGDDLDPDVFNGAFTYAGGSATAGGNYGSFGVGYLGDAHTPLPDGISSTDANGLDIGFSAVFGYSDVISKEKVKCDEEKKETEAGYCPILYY